MHHADVKRTTNEKGLVYNLTLKEIKGFSAGDSEKVPTLGSSGFSGTCLRPLNRFKHTAKCRKPMKTA